MLFKLIVSSELFLFVEIPLSARFVIVMTYKKYMMSCLFNRVRYKQIFLHLLNTNWAHFQRLLFRTEGDSAVVPASRDDENGHALVCCTKLD